MLGREKGGVKLRYEEAIECVERVFGFTTESDGGMGRLDSWVKELGVVYHFDVEGRVCGCEIGRVKSDGSVVSQEIVGRLGKALLSLSRSVELCSGA